MTDETTPDDVGPTAMEAYEATRTAVRRADESLTMLAGVPIASTQGARHAMDATRLTVLDRLLDEVRAAVGLERPAAPGQLGLEEADDARR